MSQPDDPADPWAEYDARASDVSQSELLALVKHARVLTEQRHSDQQVQLIRRQQGEIDQLRDERDRLAAYTSGMRTRILAEGNQREILEARAEVARLMQERAALQQQLRKAKTFIEYARYVLEPGLAKFPDQFPKQEDADKVIAELAALLAAEGPSSSASSPSKESSS